MTRLGRVSEGLKGDLGLPVNHHGIIMDNGHYLDGQGNYLGNILDYL